MTNVYFDTRTMQRAHNAPVLGALQVKVVLIIWGYEEILQYEYRFTHILKTNIAVSQTHPTKEQYFSLDIYIMTLNIQYYILISVSK